MAKHRLLVIVCILLFLVNAVMLVSYFQFRNAVMYTLKSNEKLSSNYSSVYNNLVSSITNDGSFIDLKTFVNDMDIIPMSSIFSNSNTEVLICRVSDRYCNSCVDNAVQLFKRVTKNYDQNRIVYFLDCNEKRVFNMQVKLWAIDYNHTFNVPMFATDSEYANFPYYMVVDSSWHIVATYFPNKSHNDLDSVFIDKMYSRIVKQCKYDNKYFRRDSIDLGNFTHAKMQNIEYHFNNISNSKIIEKITTSCDCVTAELVQNDFESGEIVKININYIAELHGDFFREVYIWTKDADKPFTIVLRGYGYCPQKCVLKKTKKGANTCVLARKFVI